MIARKALFRCIFFLAIAGVLISATALAAQNPDTLDSRLITAQIENQRAQAEYYRRQTGEFNWQKITDNPTAFAALLAATIAFFSFTFNYRATLRQQRDTQFYETLKRFGDSDHPAIQASAAGMLAQFAKIRQAGFSTTFPFIVSRPYTRTVVTQFAISAQLDENRAVLDAIVAAAYVAPVTSRYDALESLYLANERLKQDLWERIVDYSFSRDSEITNMISTGELVTIAGYDKDETVKYLLKKHVAEIDHLKVQLARSDSEDVPDPVTARRMLRLAFYRLQVHAILVKLYIEQPFDRYRRSLIRLLGRRPSTRWALRSFLPAPFFYKSCLPELDLWGAVIRDGWFEAADLQCVSADRALFYKCMLAEADLSGADLKSASLVACNLRAVNLTEADLSDATLIDVDLSGATLKNSRLAGVKCKPISQLKGVEWWKADFTDKFWPNKVDTALMELFISEAGAVPDDSPDVHPSVVKYLQNRRLGGSGSGESVT